MAAKLKYNEDHSAMLVTVDDEEWEQDPVSDDDDIFVLPDGNKLYAVCPEGCTMEGVEPNTVYELVKVVTIVAPDGALEDDEAEPEV
jgi:hypothetical protein